MIRLICLLFALTANAELMAGKTRSSGIANLYKFENSVVFVKVRKRSYPKGDSTELLSRSCAGTTERSARDWFVASGHGVIVSHDGYILVSNSLLDEALQATVVIPDEHNLERILPAKVIARDLRTDLALLKIDVKTFTSGKMSSVKTPQNSLNGSFSGSNNLKPAVWADGVVKGANLWIVAAPYNMRFSLLKSVVSHDARPAHTIAEVKSCYGNVCEVFESKVVQYETSTTLSSGILFDEDGKLVGITTPVFAHLGGVGMNFAIPCTVAKRVVYDLMANGKVSRAYAGIKMHSIDSKLFKANEMDKIPTHETAKLFGAVVVDLEKDGPAAKAGVLPQDIIVTINGQLVLTSDDAREKIGEQKAEAKMVLEVWRKVCVAADTISAQGADRCPPKGGEGDASKVGIKSMHDQASINTEARGGLIRVNTDIVSAQSADKPGPKGAQGQTSANAKPTSKLTTIATIGDYQLVRIEVTTKAIEAKKPNIDVNASRHVGLKLTKLSKDDALSRAKYSVGENIQYGLIITDISDLGLAHELNNGDVIMRVQHKAVHELADFDKIIANALKNNEKYIILLVGRRNSIFSCAVETANIKLENIQ